MKTRLLIGAALLAVMLAAGGVASGLAGFGAPQVIKDAQGCTANEFAPRRSDDGSAANVPLGFEVNFYGSSYSTANVNNNGNITFNGEFNNWTAAPLDMSQRAIIAPFLADVDTRDFYNQSGVTTYGQTMFNGHAAFCVNWVDVGYYSQHHNNPNSFQLLLVDHGGGDFDIYFNYDQILWETGDFSEGINGLGGDSARAGFASGPGNSYELPGSAVDGAFLDSNPNGLVHSSINWPEPGRYYFPFRGGQPQLVATPEATSTSTQAVAATATRTPTSPAAATPTRTRTPGGGPTSTPPSGSLAGDVNCDGRVNSLDSVLLLQFGAGLVNSLSCQGNADVNDDGRVNSLDATLVLQFGAGLINRLPV